MGDERGDDADRAGPTSTPRPGSAPLRRSRSSWSSSSSSMSPSPTTTSPRDPPARARRDPLRSWGSRPRLLEGCEVSPIYWVGSPKFTAGHPRRSSLSSITAWSARSARPTPRSPRPTDVRPRPPSVSATAAAAPATRPPPTSTSTCGLATRRSSTATAGRPRSAARRHPARCTGSPATSGHPRVKGESYKVDVYERAIGRAFEHVAVSSRLKVDTVALARRPEPGGGDVLATARIARERDRAALQFARDRDLGRLEATMARLDAEAAAAVVHPSRIPTAAEARAYLEELPTLWAKTSDAGRHAIAEAVSSGSTSWGRPTSRSR